MMATHAPHGCEEANLKSNMNMVNIKGFVFMAVISEP